MDSLSYVTVSAPVPPDCLPLRLLRQFGDSVHGLGEPFGRHSEHLLVVCNVRGLDNEALAPLHRAVAAEGHQQSAIGLQSLPFSASRKALAALLNSACSSDSP